MAVQEHPWDKPPCIEQKIIFLFPPPQIPAEIPSRVVSKSYFFPSIEKEKRPRTPERLRDSCMSRYEFKKKEDDIHPLIRGLKVSTTTDVSLRGKQSKRQKKKKVTFGKNKFPVTKKPSSYPGLIVLLVNRDFSLAFSSFRASAAGRLQAVGLLVGCL